MTCGNSSNTTTTIQKPQISSAAVTTQLPTESSFLSISKERDSTTHTQKSVTVASLQKSTSGDTDKVACTAVSHCLFHFVGSIFC